MSFKDKEDEDAIIEWRDYNGFNQLTKVNRPPLCVSYCYRPDGLRHSKYVSNPFSSTSKATVHHWDGQHIVQETVDGKVQNKYLRGINLIALQDGGELRYYLFNLHGDVVRLTDKSGTVVKEYDYDAFGNLQGNGKDKEDTNPFRYCGEYWDAETGTVYLRARYYNPATSCMLSEDPYWRYNNNPTPNINEIMQSANLYVYCANNPLSFIDPNGLDMRIIVNTNSAAAWEGGPKMGHMGVLVQNADSEWYYFSAGSNYVQFDKVGDEYLKDLEKFSEKYYGGYESVGAYNKSVYIKGDFTGSFDFYKDYYEANKADSNASSYKILTNNCSHIVIEGFNKGTLGDGTNAGWFVIERMGINFGHSALPRWQINDFQNIFFNDAFSYDDYHSQINDQLWEYRNSPFFWKRSNTAARFIERII